MTMTTSRKPRYLELSGMLTPEHEALRDQSHAFAADVMRPASLELDRMSPEEVIAPGSPLRQAFSAWYALGQHSAALPSEVGGVGLDPLGQALVFEELGWGAADLAVSLGVAAWPFLFAATFGLLTGNRRLLDEIVAPFVEDREGKIIGCWAITEPGHGSDELGVGTDSFERPESAGNCRAVRDGSDWVIRGQKAAWVSNGTIASHALLYCTVDPTRGMAGGGVAVVPLGLPGVSKGAPLDKMGQRALNQGEIFFDDVRIPGDYMLVGIEEYPGVLDLTLTTANSGMGVIFTGLARSAFEEALDYAAARVQGGKPISDHQLVQTEIFEMFSRVESARALSRAVMARTATDPSLPHAIASKVTCTRTAFEVANRAIQVHGGSGLVRGSFVEKLLRDARAALIEDGVNEFLGLVAARRLAASLPGGSASLQVKPGGGAREPAGSRSVPETPHAVAS
ncbi:MAG: acyl-CoA dehydrogenase family protein [Acidimicrobiales bacterium]|nr:acyl-CoA/acyl-ACP dehydrogenase [Actinomycetota bacterium]